MALTGKTSKHIVNQNAGVVCGSGNDNKGNRDGTDSDDERYWHPCYNFASCGANDYNARTSSTRYTSERLRTKYYNAAHFKEECNWARTKEVMTNPTTTSRNSRHSGK